MAKADHPFHIPGLRIPRFLFRGFNRYSGGGIPGQNTIEGIFPLAFLQGHETEMQVGRNTDPWMLLDRAMRHLCQKTSPPTPFSSVTHDWRTALTFSCTRVCEKTGRRKLLSQDHQDHDSYIAVLDTWALGDEKTLLNRIFHVPQFGVDYPCEWLIWGPVSGPAYRCVPVSKIRETIGCQKWPGHLPCAKEEPYLLLTDVRDSLLVAGCFQRNDDTSADVMLAVAASELASRLSGNPKTISGRGDPEAVDEGIWPQEVLEDLVDALALCNPVLSGRPLVHGHSALVGFPRVRLMYTLLREAEACWGNINSHVPWAPVNWRQIFLREKFAWRNSRPPWRLWITTLVAASGIVLLLTGLRWQSSRHRITYFNPPERGDTGPERPPDRVDGVGSEPGHPTIKPTVSVPPKQPVAPVGQGNTNDYGLSVEDAANATLGFAELIVINMPDRTDKRDRMTLMGATTGLRFTFLPGVDAAKVPDSAMPPKAAGWTGKVRASWRAHMDALWYIVQHNLSSAVIFEDDLDWDVRIREQARDFALASRALLQPLEGRSVFADPTYPTVQEQDAGLDPPPLSFVHLPKTEEPTTSPYGDGWDVLWLGHCGVQQPTGDPKDQWAERSRHISRGAVVKEKDPSVPQTGSIHSWDDDGHARFRDSYPAHTRVTHHALDAVCTFAYGVSQAGARRILYDLGLWKMDDPFDLGLRQFCDGTFEHARHVCLTTQPSLFSHFEKKEGSDLDHEKTWNIRWSARENLVKLLDGKEDYEDQWPDTLWKA